MRNSADILISVIIPVYNSGERLIKCINSLKKQTIKNIELILIDDGSDEFTRKLCDDIGENSENVIVIHKKNEGPSLARQAGIMLASGEYISFVDSDDFVEHDFLEELHNNALKYSAEIVQGGCYFEYEKDEQLNHTLNFSFMIIEGQPEISNIFAKHQYFTDYLCNKLFNKDLFANITFPAISRGEDRCLLTQLYGNAQKVLNINIAGYHYIQHDASLSHGGLGNNEFDIFKATAFIEDYYKENHLILCQYNHAFHCSQAIQLFFKAETKEEKNFLTLQIGMYEVSNMRFVSVEQKYLIKIFKISPRIAKLIYKCKGANV